MENLVEKKWIALKHGSPENENKVLVEWMLGNQCNYNCEYCPSHLKNGSIQWPSYQQVIQFCRRLNEHYSQMGRRLAIQFTGGEPTLFPNFDQLLGELRDMRAHIGISSNATPSYDWWVENDDKLDFVYLTYHVGFTEFDHFKKVMQLLGRTRWTHVNIPILPQRFEETIEVARRLADGSRNVSIGLKPLYINFGPELYPYTEEQRKRIYSTYFYLEKTVPSRFPRNYMRKIFDDNTEAPIRALQLAVSKQNKWEGWTCNIGIESLVIELSGRILRSHCGQTEPIGTIFDESIRLPEAPVICKKTTCNSLADILTTRWLV